MTYPNSHWAAELAGLSIAAMDHNPILCQQLAQLAMDMTGLADDDLRAEAMAKLCSLAILYHTSEQDDSVEECARYAVDWVNWMGSMPTVGLN